MRVSSPARHATVLLGAPTVAFPRMLEQAVVVAYATATGSTATDTVSEASTTGKVRRVASIAAQTISQS